jgi:hypothetical protein
LAAVELALLLPGALAEQMALILYSQPLRLLVVVLVVVTTLLELLPVLLAGQAAVAVAIIISPELMLAVLAIPHPQAQVRGILAATEPIKHRITVLVVVAGQPQREQIALPAQPLEMVETEQHLAFPVPQ